MYFALHFSKYNKVHQGSCTYDVLMNSPFIMSTLTDCCPYISSTELALFSLYKNVCIYFMYSRHVEGNDLSRVSFILENRQGLWKTDI